MSSLFWLTDEQMERLKPFFPKSHGVPRVDDPLPGNGLRANRERGRVLSGIIFINRNGLRQCDAPRKYGLPKTLYNRWKRWGDMGGFARMMEGLASEGTEHKTVMIDATDLKAHPLPGSTCNACARAAWLQACGRKMGPDDQRGRLIGRTKGGMNRCPARHCEAMAREGPICMPSPTPRGGT